MAASNRKELFLQVSGSVTPLRQVLKGGSAALVEFAGDATKQLEAVEKSLQDLGGNPGEAAKRLTSSYNAAFAEIRRNAQEVLSAPTGQGAVAVINAGAARQAAEGATAQANALRLVADAAKSAALEQGGANTQLTAYATAAIIAADDAGKYALALREQATTLGIVEGKLAGTVVANRNAKQMSDQHRYAMTNLGQQFTDFTVQVTSGQSAVIAFAQQMPQAAGALAGFEGKLGAVGAALNGPWGIALQVGMIALTPLVGKLLEGGDASDDMRGKTLTLVDALSIEKIGTEDGAKAIKAFNEEKQRSIDLSEQGAAATIQDARAKLNYAMALRAVFAASAPGLGTEELDERIADLREAIDHLELDADRKAADAIADPIEGIRQRWEAQIAAAEKTLRGVMRQVTIASYKMARDAEIAAEQERQSKLKHKPAASNGETPTSALLATAERYKGANEGTAGGREVLQTLFKQAGITIDPKMTAWCAAFVNAVLATNGLKGSGSLAARSFLDFGTKTDAPQKGDIVVLKRDGGGHVGFFEGFDKQGNVQVLGGNQGPSGQGKVSVASFKRSDVLGFRRAPTSPQDQEAQAAAGAAKAEQEKARELARVDAFQDQLTRAKAQQLQAVQALTRGTESEVDVQFERLEAERKETLADIDRQVAAGKLKPAEAEQLKAVLRKTAVLRGELAIREEESRQVRKQLDADLDAIDAQRTLLNLQGELATTVADRKRIALNLLKLDEDERRKRARAILSDPNATPDDKKKAERDLARVDAEHGGNVAIIERRNAAPLDAYKQELREATADTNAALQDIAVNGFHFLEDQVAGSISKVLGLKGAVGDFVASALADLAKLELKKGLLSFLETGSIFGVKLFSTGKVPGHEAAHVAGFADGIIRGPGTGTSDSILAVMDGLGLIRVSNGESIMTAQATRRFGPMLKAMNDNSLPGFATGLVAPLDYVPRIPSAASAERAVRPARAERLQLDADIKISPTPEFDARMERVSFRTVGQAAEPIMAGAEKRVVRRLSRGRLPGGVAG